MEPALRTKEANELFRAVAKLRDAAECKKFMRDLCTLAELEAMSERFKVAKMVSAEKSYREISRKTGASTATVTRVAHWLHHGTGGYKLVLDRTTK